jgi:hypothetical protein
MPSSTVTSRLSTRSSSAAAVSRSRSGSSSSSETGRRTKLAPCSLRGDPLRLRQPRVGGLGETSHGAAHTAGALVRGAAHHAAIALAPLLEQRGRQQRQAARLVKHILDQGIRERRLHPEPDPPSGLDDRPPQLVAPHRADEHLVRADEPREPVVGTAMSVEVGADRDHDLHAAVAVLGERCERIQKPGPLTLVAADREDLLELVHDENRLIAGLGQGSLERRQRTRARAHHRLRPAVGARQHSTRQRRQ